MRGTRKTAYLALLVAGFVTLIQAVAQTPLQLSTTRQIRKGVDAWPQILNPKNDEERRINGYLNELNDLLFRSLKDCHSNYSERMSKRVRATANGDEGAEFWTQHTKVTMLGPAIISLVATTDFYCGGAHPYGFTDAVVFDLKTGRPSDLITWFLPSLNASLIEGDEKSPALEKSVLVPGLLRLYREATHHECDGTYSDDQSFLVWPDANSGRVMMQADRLPGCCQACGIETGLTSEQARKFGFSEVFLQEIDDAHRKITHR